jgi:hypothetical protein
MIADDSRLISHSLLESIISPVDIDQAIYIFSDYFDFFNPSADNSSSSPILWPTTVHDSKQYKYSRFPLSYRLIIFDTRNRTHPRYFEITINLITPSS